MYKFRDIELFDEFLIKETRLGMRETKIFGNDRIETPTLEFSQTGNNATGTMLSIMLALPSTA